MPEGMVLSCDSEDLLFIPEINKMSAPEKIESNCAVIILAAGRSARLGSPKQLLPYRDKTLLQHSIDAALGSNAKPIIAVLGSGMEIIEHELVRDKIFISENTSWENGMASSISCGLNALNNLAPGIESVILMVCDQPFINPGLLNDLIKKQKSSGSSIVASFYENTIGTPALFHKKHFPELASLEGDTGARSLFKKYAETLQIIPFDKGGIDIDTIENYRNLAK